LQRRRNRSGSSLVGVIPGRFVQKKRGLEQAVGRNGDRVPQPVGIGLPVSVGQRIKIFEQRAPRRLQQVESRPGRCRPGGYCFVCRFVPGRICRKSVGRFAIRQLGKARTW
jgi:hypothetical protein